MNLNYDSIRKFSLSVFLSFLFFSNVSAQIGKSENVIDQTHIGYNNNITKFHSLSYHVDDQGNKLYLLHFRNMEYQNIDVYCSISFNATDGELEYFYKTLKDGLIDKIGQTIDVGKHKIYIVKFGMSVQISDISPNTAKNYFWLTSKEIDRLFGKIK
jgi:hypothetical protein